MEDTVRSASAWNMDTESKQTTHLSNAFVVPSKQRTSILPWVGVAEAAVVESGILAGVTILGSSEQCLRSAECRKQASVEEME